MLAQSRSPEHLAPDELDAFLAEGWFRMGQTIFTTNFIRYQKKIYSTIWLRVALDNYVADAAQLKLFKQNASFKTRVSPISLSDEKEELYSRYQKSLSFPASESLQHLLLGDVHSHSIYDTYEVTIHDGDKLIAVGFFDKGLSSAEGIISVYDPAYKKYSLGKYLIYLKMQYCQQLKLRYFYPGYFAPGNPYFDYKLTIGRSALEFLQLSTYQWLSIDQFSDNHIPYQAMYTKLSEVQKLLAPFIIGSQITNYDYFDAQLIPDLREEELFDFPVFLYSPKESDAGVHPVVIYDVRDACYHLRLCIPFWQPHEINPDSTVYSAFVLKTIHEIHFSLDAEEIASEFLKVVLPK